MSTAKKRGLILLIACFVAALLFAVANKYYNIQPIELNIQIKSDRMDKFQVYYDTIGDKSWNEENSESIMYSGSNNMEELKFKIPVDTKNIRVDFGTVPYKVKVGNFHFKKNKIYSVNIDNIDYVHETKCSKVLDDMDYNFSVESYSNDSYIVIQNLDSILPKLGEKNVVLSTIMMVVSLLLGLAMGKSLMWAKESIKFVKLSLNNVSMIKSLSKNDFKNKFASSYLGIIWGFIQPLVTIAVYWFVFQVGFRSTDVGNVPFILWFIAGIIPWFFFSEAFPSATGVFNEYSYLVKKVVFKIEILPCVKIVSALFVHLFFILFIYVVSTVYGYYPDLCSLQFIYYCFAMIVLIYSLSIITSSIVLFFKDLSQIIGIIINVGFWATPIAWQLNILPDKLAFFFKLNPMYYIVTGYRDAFIYKIYFWQRPYATIYFWLFCLITLLVGVKIFNKLRPHFSDVI